MRPCKEKFTHNKSYEVSLKQHLDQLIKWLQPGSTAPYKKTSTAQPCVCHMLLLDRFPLEQLEARLAVRSNRPAAEAVEDEVQAALAAEAAQLSAVRTQLQARATAAAQHVAHLNSVSAALLQHIADKGQALSLEEKVALMDGRKLVAVPPSPTVLSVSAQWCAACSSKGGA